MADVLVINATDGCWDKVDLSWSPVERADGYCVEYLIVSYSESPDDWTRLAVVEGQATTSMVHSDLEPIGHTADNSKNYRYRVFASLEDSLSQGSPTDTGSFESSTVEDFTVYGTPAAVKLRWDAVSNATGYRIEYRGSSTEPLDWAPLTDVAGTTEFAHTASEDSLEAVRFEAGSAYRATGLKIEYRNLDGGDPVDWTLLQTTLDDHTATSSAMTVSVTGTGGSTISPVASRSGRTA